jgi:hypothetical protein
MPRLRVPKFRVKRLNSLKSGSGEATGSDGARFEGF